MQEARYVQGCVLKADSASRSGAVTLWAAQLNVATRGSTRPTIVLRRGAQHANYDTSNAHSSAVNAVKKRATHLV
jgi:3-deoxy-D-arabino-heptulosonate 7-phosphate (DAHP) synthase